MLSPGSRPVEVLLVEDSPNDAADMREALEESDLAMHVTVVDDGEDAVRYLRRQPPFEDATRPDLILLDMHLPRMNGHEVLADIKQDEVLRRIPVILLTGLPSDSVFIGAYDLHANCCVSKPANLGQLALIVKKIEHFWLRIASTVRNQ
jgi:CheY-like chemotaxis protein